MLALVRSRAALSSVQYARPLCAAADPDKIIRDIEASIATAKKLIETPPKKAGYSEAALQSDVAAGSINTLKLGQIFDGDDDLKKSMMKMASQINVTKSQLSTQKLPEINWDKYDELFSNNGMEPGLVDTLKKTFSEQEAKFTAAVEKAKSEDLANGHAEISKQFDGPSGISEQFKSVDETLKKDRVGYLAQLESLLHESSNIDTLTIAEILEKNPEWQKAIEEDIKNHNWGAEPPASLVREMEGTAEESTKA